MDINYHTNLVKGPLRDDIKPLNITQPEVCPGLTAGPLLVQSEMQRLHWYLMAAAAAQGTSLASG
jgi:hypothetical protein